MYLHKNRKEMATEFEKIRSVQYANTADAEVKQRLVEGKAKVHALNQTYCGGPAYREALEDLVPTIPASSAICPPFYCDYGDGIRVGEHVFINMNCTFLDGAYIDIGDYTLIGPNVQIYTPHHPLDAHKRRKPIEISYPVRIGKDCWIGGGSIICPGVSIGDRVVVGAGSVVTKDIPSDTIVAGVPARQIKDPDRASKGS